MHSLAAGAGASVSGRAACRGGPSKPRPCQCLINVIRVSSRPDADGCARARHRTRVAAGGPNDAEGESGEGELPRVEFEAEQLMDQLGGDMDEEEAQQFLAGSSIGGIDDEALRGTFGEGWVAGMVWWSRSVIGFVICWLQVALRCNFCWNPCSVPRRMLRSLCCLCLRACRPIP